MPIVNLTNSNIQVNGESVSAGLTKLLPANNPIYLRVSSPLNSGSPIKASYSRAVLIQIETGHSITINGITFTAAASINSATDFLNYIAAGTIYEACVSFCEQFNQHILFKNDWFANPTVVYAGFFSFITINFTATRSAATQLLTITNSGNFVQGYNPVAGKGSNQGDDNYQYGIFAEVWTSEITQPINTTTPFVFDPNVSKRLAFIERNYSKDNNYLFEVSSIAQTILPSWEPLNWKNELVYINNIRNIFFRIGQMYSLTENGYRQRNLELTSNIFCVWDGDVGLTSTNSDKAAYWYSSSGVKLLTNQPTVKNISTEWDKEILCVLWKGHSGFNTSKLRLRIIFNYSDGTSETKYNVFPNLLTNQFGLYYAYVDYPKVLPYSDSTKEIESYEVGFEYGLGSGAGTLFTNTQKYIINRDCSTSENIGLIFKNKLGGFDSLILKNDVVFSSDRKIDYYTKAISENLSNATFVKATSSINFEKFMEVKTNNLSKDEWEWLADLVVSKQVYLVYENNIYAVNITDTNHGYNSSTTDNSITIKLEFSIPDKI